MPFQLLDSTGRTVPSYTPGLLGGNRRLKIYGRLDCPSARRALPRGYARHRVFFADEATAVAAGYRPCAVCMRAEYREWKASAATRGSAARLTRALGAILALALGVAHAAFAQGDRPGRLEGTVTDSIHARPLAGVRVVAAGTGAQADIRAEATSDSAGRYRIDSLAPGRYLVGFESPLLDSLEIVLPPREAVIAPMMAAASLDLATPSAAKLHAALCSGDTLAKGTGVVYGHVVSAETESPLAGLGIALQWRDLAFDRKSLRAVNSTRDTSVTTDERGWYHACGVPTGAWLSMQIQDKGRLGPVLRARVDDTLGIASRHLSFSSPTTNDSAGVATVIAPFTGTATLTGVVRGAGGIPVASAEVRVRGARSSGLTDEQGSYTVSGLPAGTRELEVRHIGYAVAEASVELRNGATTRSDVQMQRIVNLDSVRVVATRARYPEFSAHRKSAVFGHFLGPEEIQRRRAIRTSDLIRPFGGFLMDYSRGRPRIVSARGASTSSCGPNIVIDGMDLGRMDPEAISVDDFLPTDIGAIEIYREGDMGPPEYDKGCGLIVIWTKR
jgi:hypothetical protein